MPRDPLSRSPLHFLVPCQTASLGQSAPSIRDKLHFDHTWGRSWGRVREGWARSGALATVPGLTPSRSTFEVQHGISVCGVRALSSAIHPAGRFFLVLKNAQRLMKGLLRDIECCPMRNPFPSITRKHYKDTQPLTNPTVNRQKLCTCTFANLHPCARVYTAHFFDASH